MYSEVSPSVFVHIFNPYGHVGVTKIFLCVFIVVDSFCLLTNCKFYTIHTAHILNCNLMVLRYSVWKLPVDDIRC